MADGDICIRPARPDDHDFILSLVPRFTDFPLPPWRAREVALHGIEKDFRHHLADDVPGSFLFVAEDATGRRCGFLHLKLVQDFFTGASNCHISDLATLPHTEGRGIGSTLLAHAEAWAGEQGCALVTLNVFPGNERALELYRRKGYATDMLHLAKPLNPDATTT